MVQIGNVDLFGDSLTEFLTRQRALLNLFPHFNLHNQHINYQRQTKVVKAFGLPPKQGLK